MFCFPNLRLAGTVLTPILLGLSLSCGSDSGGQIAFVSSVDGDEEVVLLDPDTRVTTPLTDNRSQDFGPRWSPDGKVLAYLSDEAGDSEVMLVDPREELVRSRRRRGGSQPADPRRRRRRITQVVT